MKKLFFLFLIWTIVSSNLYSQNLSFTRNGKTKTLTEKDFLQVYISKKVEEENNKCLDCIQMKGYISSVYNDSIQMRIQSISQTKKVNGVNVNKEFFSKEISNTYRFTKSEIYAIRNLKTPLKSKRKRFFSGTGAIFMLTGLATLATSLAIENPAAKTRLQQIGVVEFGLGIAFISFSQPKKYLFKKDENHWKF